MTKYFKFFWYLYLVDIIFTGGFKILDYVLGTQLLVLFKIPLLISFTAILIFHVKNKLIFNKVSKLFLIFGSFSLIYGVIANIDTLDLKILPNIYTFFMPIFAISFGIHFAINFDLKNRKLVGKVMKYGLYISIVIVSLYLFFHYITGQIPYFGFGNELHFIGIYFLTNKQVSVYLICLFLVVASGKRSTILNISLASMIYFRNYFSISKSLKSLFSTSLVLIILFFSFNWALNNGAFRRFEESLKFDITDSRSTFIATSGRWQEIEGVVKHLNKNSYKWLIGSGLGDKYLYEDFIYGFSRTELKHYAHFTPIGYTFLYGLIFTSLLYYYIFSYFLKNFREYHKNFYFISFCIMFFAAFFGSQLFTSHMPWFFLGIISQFQNKNKNNLLITNQQI